MSDGNAQGTTSTNAVSVGAGTEIPHIDDEIEGCAQPHRAHDIFPLISEGHCLLCGRLVSAKETYLTRDSWAYLRCPACRMVFLHPAPDEESLRSYYNNNYQVDFKSYLRSIRRRSDGTLRELESRLPRRGKLLEIGCSYGGFLAEARSFGWQVEGVELSEGASRYAREQLGVRVLTGRLEDQIPSLDGPFDAVALFHVIEHVPDPIRFLRLCSTLLRPGGLLVLKTPNIESLAARLAGPLWQWVSPPAHLALLSPGTLELLLRQAGYIPETIRSLQGDAHNNLFEALGSVAKRILSRSGEDAIDKVRKTRHKRIAESVCEVVYFPFRFALDRWLASRMLQPELHALASIPGRGAAA